jgi:hypothetical protein
VELFTDFAGRVARTIAELKTFPKSKPCSEIAGFLTFPHDYRHIAVLIVDGAYGIFSPPLS